jgi:hypothetical protein
MPLRSLAGASAAVGDEIKKQVTRVKTPAERPVSPVGSDMGMGNTVTI